MKEVPKLEVGQIVSVLNGEQKVEQMTVKSKSKYSMILSPKYEVKTKSDKTETIFYNLMWGQWMTMAREYAMD